MTKVLALDLGAKMGFCFLEQTLSQFTERPATTIASGTKHLAGERPARLAQLHHWLEEMMSHEPDAVVYETPFCRGMHATRSSWGAAGVVEAVCSEFAAVLDVHNSTIKKWAGWTKGSKEGTLKRCQELGITPLDDNHADAVCLAYYTLETMEVIDGK